MRNQHATFFFLFSLALGSQAQGIKYASQTKIERTILDSKTQQPIPYRNIVFVKKGIGTFSDGERNYTLEFAPATLESTDEIKFSVLGYKSHILIKRDTLLSSRAKISAISKVYSLHRICDAKRKKRDKNHLSYGSHRKSKHRSNHFKNDKL